jgi:hypothetical protein
VTIRTALATALLLGTLACGSNTVSPPSSNPQTEVRTYTGTASVGDFFNISLDPNAQTLTYTDVSNNDSATVAYTTNANGSYTFSDPNGNLLTAFEVPNYALLIQAAKTGPNRDTLALVTAVETSQITMSTIASNIYNYMQFRTTSGGADIGSVNIDAQSNFTTSSYWPYGAQNQQNPFSSSSMPGSGVQEDPSGTFLTMTGIDAQPSYIFGTANGIFAVDTPNGAILGLKQAATKAFDASYAGTYQAMYYRKVNASFSNNNVETGTPNMGFATLTIDAVGNVTLQDTQNNIKLAAGTLVAVADTPYLYGPNELLNPCYGLFTFRVTTPTTQQDFYMTFLNQAVLFSSYKSLPQVSGSSMYNYFYGVALK